MRKGFRIKEKIEKMVVGVAIVEYGRRRLCGFSNKRKLEIRHK